MCGIAGRVQFGTSQASSDSQHSVRAMTDVIAHRGPDHTDFGIVGAAVFGFQRLALLSLDNGDQPFFGADGNVMLMVNGEIYNHRELRQDLEKRNRFSTESDCEVLLHGYLEEGIAYLDKLNGMFAFALFDNRKGRLILGRDRFGIKPLSYHFDGERIVFASETKALFADRRTPREVDWQGALTNPGLNLDLAFTTEPPTSWFKDIHVVPAAHFTELNIATRELTTTRYWNASSGPDLTDASEEEIVRIYRDALAASVRDCLTADIEVGLFLSGGIDSAAVAAFARGSGIPTFTALTGSTYVNGDAEYSHRTALECGLDNHQVIFDRNRIPSSEEWRTILWALETPQASPEHFYKFELHRFARQTRPGLKAMMLGQASDEFNGGYSQKLSAGRGYETYLRTIETLETNTGLLAMPELAPWFDPSHGQLLRRDVLPGVSADPYRHYLDWKLHDIEQYNNWHEDRTAAANSIEARVPFLDHRVVEITNAVPRKMHASLFWDKAILRRALKGLLPTNILERPKVSFFYDDPSYNNQRTFIQMILQGSGELLDDALSSKGATQWLDKANVFAAVERLKNDPSDSSMEYLLAVMNLGLLENMLDSQPRTLDRRDNASVPIELRIEDWDASRDEVRDAVLYAPPLNEHSTLARGPQVSVLRNVNDPNGSEIVAVDGRLAFTLDGVDRAAWVLLLSLLTEPMNITLLAAEMAVSGEEVKRLCLEGLDAGVLELRA
ncbi:asparagine synthase (glutamine-hydrolyzing) [Agreia bicolorata]|uniref:asparagine synthase (glutamine-hydrolyzing) n=1 Tax=Agreia bicolorata TaxID=110935 RepID=A0ABR5CE17_9MICO|nr:asparagine synthase (glutamine-hydrolyzing) [Agreia bicolorata]KJC63890.1 hypothetical protein TZ00_12835 [Agreia bicolorata]